MGIEYSCYVFFFARVSFLGQLGFVYLRRMYALVPGFVKEQR